MAKYIKILLIYCEFIAIVSCKTNLDDYKKYKEFLNYGDLKLTKAKNEVFEDNASKTKVDVLGEIFKTHIDEIKLNDQLDVIFLIDSSSSVGENNFDSEIKFVKKLLSDIPVDYNHTRIAIVTYSSDRNIVKNIDEITNPNEENNKCLLLNDELKKVKFSGGGTYTLGAFVKAQEIFNKSRTNSKKVLFLITDGYSNGGDPVPIANDLKNDNVVIFTLGIKNGNYRELFDLSSTPGEFYSYLLDSFQEFENLARRALHVDFKRGDYIPLSATKLCDKLCVGGDCCDSNAVCTCGTSTGHYTCLCKPGFYGSGLKNTCTTCPSGTYADGPNLCIPCPDIHHITVPPAIGKKSCKCKPGYQSADGDKCEVIKCSKLVPPANGYFVKKKQCSNVLNSACGVRCLVGYTLTGSSIRLCQSNASWSGHVPSCHVKTCDRPKTPPFGSVTCKHDDLDVVYESEENLPVDTVCTFGCDQGRTLIGSSERTCLPLAQWDGLKTSCKQLKCNKLAKIPNAKVEPKSCTIGKQPYGKKCNVTCYEGFELIGSGNLQCTGHQWNDKKEMPRCIDKIPPEIICPDNIEMNSSKGNAYGQTTWKEPVPKDNINLQILMWTEPAIANITEYKFKIGMTNVTYFARDAFNNTANCTFSVTVIDNEPPVIEDCTDPPTYLVHNTKELNITWDVPLIYDNSETVTVDVSHGFGYFNVGTTQVTYNATDAALNTNQCVLNITVEEQKCDDIPDPLFGSSNCVTASGFKQCVITCQEGYALPLNIPMDIYDMDNGTKFICNVSNPIWYNLEGQTFPDCTITIQPQEVVQEGTIAMNVTNSTDVCDNSEKRSQLENDIENEISNGIIDACDGMDCKLNASADCEEDVEREVEEDRTNKIKKRETTSTEKKPKKKKEKTSMRIKFRLEVKSNRTFSGDKIRTTLSNNAKYDIKLNKLQLVCPNGYVQRKSKCAQCPVGTFHNLTSNVCESCPFGQFNDLVAQVECKPCPLHHSTRRMKTKSSKKCVSECPPGTHARNKTMKMKSLKTGPINKLTLSPYCRSCGIGQYQSHFNQLRCIKCPRGYTTNGRNSKSIQDCIPTIETLCNNGTRNICNFGRCKLINSFEYKCICRVGYIGSHCEHKLNPCDSGPCLNGGTCTDNGNFYRCECPKGASGSYCQDVDSTCDKCLNKGQCVETADGDSICLCPKGYYGDKCEEKMKRCHANLCENNARCVESSDSYKCICKDGFFGKRCNLLPCDYAPCNGNKSCTNMLVVNANRKSFRCECPTGYKGTYCHEKILYCASNPCLNNGRCIENLDGYKCDCAKSFNGTNCVQELFGNYTLNFANISTTNYAKMRGPTTDLSQISVCTWMQSTDKFNYGTILSYATPEFDNALTVTDYTGLVLYINNKHVITSIRLNDGEWHFICINWENVNGNYQIYVDGKFLKIGTQFAKGETIKGGGILIVGQDQDVLGGEFSQSESYIGKLSNLDVWNYTLSEIQMKQLMESCDDISCGNLYAWPEFRYNVYGDVQIENSTFCELCNKPAEIINGQVNVINNTAYYKCNDGYFLNSPIYGKGRKCTKSSKWEGRQNPYCKPIYCGHPGHFNNGYIIGHNYYYLDRIFYKCYDNYNLTGNITRYCSRSGKWLPEKAPSCLYGNECPALKAPENSITLLLPDTKYEDYLEESSYIEPESQLQIKCLENYVLQGQNLLTCLENGTWNFDPPKCVPLNPITTPKAILVTKPSIIPTTTPKVMLKTTSTTKPTTVPQVAPKPKPKPALEPKPSKSPETKTTSKPQLKPSPLPEPKSTPNAVEEPIKIPNPTLKSVTKPESKTTTTLRPQLKSTMPTIKSTPIPETTPTTPKLTPKPEVTKPQNTSKAPTIIPQSESPMKLTTTENPETTTTNPATIPKAETKPTLDTESKPIPEPISTTPETTSTCQIESLPSAPDNGYVDEQSLDDFKNGDTNEITYKCRSGYILQGVSTTSCSTNNTWTSPEIYCKAIECRNPPKYKQMEIVERNTSTHYYSGNMVIYKCVEGYKLIGRDKSIRCMANGKWSKMYSKCFRISCEKPTVSDRALIKGNSYLFQDKVTIECPDKKQFVLTCTALGKWSGDGEESC